MEDKFIERRFKAIEEQQIETERTLERHTEMLKEQDEMLTKIYTEVGHANTNIGVLQHKMEGVEADVSTLKHDVAGVKADIIAIKESQADFRDRQQDHGKRFDGIDGMLKEILARLPKKGEE